MAGGIDAVIGCGSAEQVANTRLEPALRGDCRDCRDCGDHDVQDRPASGRVILVVHIGRPYPPMARETPDRCHRDVSEFSAMARGVPGPA